MSLFPFRFEFSCIFFLEETEIKNVLLIQALRKRGLDLPRFCLKERKLCRLVLPA